MKPPTLKPRVITPEVDKVVNPAAPERRWRDRLLQHEQLNFLLTNRVPRVALTLLMGRISRIRSPLFTRLALALWRQFTELDLSDAEPVRRYSSLHECFTRRLQPGARPLDLRPEVLVSPSDGIVGACGAVQGDQVFQAKGMPYSLAELLGSREQAALYEGGSYVTLRLTSAMYHRFHAPRDGHIDQVRYFSGDTWNVNPIALKRVERLFCRNERAVIRLQPEPGREGEPPLLLVPVAAILVASIRLHALDVRLHLRWRGPNVMACEAPVQRGQELGWFEHGSTIIVIAPAGQGLAPGIGPGVTVRMGQALLQRLR